VTGSFPNVRATTIRERRARRSSASSARQSAAITSEGGGDVEAGLPRDPLEDAPEADDDVAEGPVVHVEHTAPEDPPRVDVEPVPVVDVVVEERREEVVRGGDGVEVAREVEVDVVRGDEARAASSRRAPLHPERRPEGGLAERDAGPRAGPGEALGEADGGRRLPFAGARRRDRRDEDEPAARRESRRRRQNLRLVVAVRDEAFRWEAERGGRFGQGRDRGLGHRSLLGPGGGGRPARRSMDPRRGRPLR
jgi:hypothetical protein